MPPDLFDLGAHTARQDHIVESLKYLYETGVIIDWQFGYRPNDRGTTDARFGVIIDESDEGQILSTPEAERVVARLMREQGVSWLPVAHPGGWKAREAMRAKIKTMPRPAFIS